jgi:hypothetical protein
VSGLLRRALATIKGWWSRASTAVLGLLRGAVRLVRTVAVRVVGHAATVLAAIRARHRERAPTPLDPHVSGDTRGGVERPWPSPSEGVPSKVTVPYGTRERG